MEEGRGRGDEKKWEGSNGAGGHSFKYILISLMTRVCDHYSSPLMPGFSPALVAQGFAFFSPLAHIRAAEPTRFPFRYT